MGSLGAEQPVDRVTVAAVSLLAMCLVCVAHEAIGHGSACLGAAGHIKILSSSTFRCDTSSHWIDPAGPLSNVTCGLLALWVRRAFAPLTRSIELLTLLLTAFSFFWESAYLALSMLQGRGDLYFAARDWIGELSTPLRIIGASLGIVCYWATARWLSSALPKFCGGASATRLVAITAWASATTGAALAAAVYRGHSEENFRDAVLEIGACSLPLLWIPIRSRIRAIAAGKLIVEPGDVVIGRNRTAIVIGLIGYIVFTATMGRGLFF